MGLSQTHRQGLGEAETKGGWQMASWMCRNRAWAQPAQPTEKTGRRAMEEHTLLEMGGEDWGCTVCVSLHGGGVEHVTEQALDETNRSFFSPTGL